MLQAMKSQKQMALLGLGGGVALASAAFAIGSQVGGGSAVAGTSAETTAAAETRPVHNGGGKPGGPRGAFFGDLATKLGVEESKLKAALEDLRPAKADRDEHVADLARILNLDEARVQAALDKVRPERVHRRGPPDGLVAELAKDLKLDEAKVRAAFERLRPERPSERGAPPDKDAFLAALAKELGVPVADVRESLADHRRGHGPDEHKRGGPGGPASAELAKELGVSTETLDKAFETLHEERRAEFAKELAAKLSISPDKVEEVLKELPHPGRRGHR